MIYNLEKYRTEAAEWAHDFFPEYSVSQIRKLLKFSRIKKYKYGFKFEEPSYALMFIFEPTGQEVSAIFDINDLQL